MECRAACRKCWCQKLNGVLYPRTEQNSCASRVGSRTALQFASLAELLRARVADARHTAFNRIIKQVAVETGSGFVDSAVMNNVDDYFTDHVHGTPEGIQVLAVNCARFLRGRVEELR